MMFSTSCFLLQICLLIQLLVTNVLGNQIVGDILYVRAGLDSRIVVREVREGNVPLDLKIDDVVKKDHFNFIINLDAVEYIQNQNLGTDGASQGDNALIQLAQKYIPPESLASTSIIESIFTGVANLIGPYIGRTFQFVFQNFIFKYIKYVYFWVYQISKYTIKISGLYLDSVDTPEKCFYGLDWIETQAHGIYLVGWETFTLNDNCQETISSKSIETILLQAHSFTNEDSHCEFYRNEPNADAGEWYADIRTLSSTSSENIWDLKCPNSPAGNKKESILTTILTFLKTVT
ncbi:hypothetical protein CANMA_002886 [Candida margitis]|uniref:uncharacterized protein n=1 Tax=Candida margitis TaxID=1775924 RepID=UPI0022274A98|nr:uncharacterized protein CANMA_002886 [Candida margitis]KAI5967706.1 hypothetical protein CANMA_002886 [Candida margitis]